ncbi:MAG: ATP-dependent Clp protease ATP-binding subunit [Gordonia sp. (in: high G+C Gram-positive bacteria)]|nr:MAG: ATP-dependent Clp protease ATP-binding subunit [Gordonia sp. (in: high G+C Gram-positive bacteria)]
MTHHITSRRSSATIVAKGMHDFSNDDDNTGSGTGPGSGPGGPAGAGSALGAIMGGLLPGVAGPDDPDDIAKAMLTDYNDKFAAALPAEFRDEVIDRMAAALISKNKPSAILLGPAGVGKTRVVEELARRIATNDPTVPPRLRNKTIYELNLSSLVAGTMYRGMMEQKIEALIDFAKEPKNGVILFIDEIHQLVPADNHGSSSHEELAQSLKPALARGDLRVIGATTDQEGRRLTSDPAFSRRFTRIGVSELNQDQTRQVLGTVLPGLLAHYKKAVSADEKILDHVIALADEHLTALHRPDSALTLLDRALAQLTVTRHKPDIAASMTPGDPLPLTRATIKKTAESMHGSDAVARGFDENALTAALSRIEGQDAVCARAISLLRRDARGIFPRRQPMGWMFAGTSGVGKTEVARQIAQSIMGTEPIIFNMAEFSEPASITRLLGSAPGYVGSDSNKEMPFDPLDANPRQVIVLDEFEKAHRDVQRIFLSALQEGTVRMASGKTVDFSKALIIATTNAGRDSIAKGGLSLGFSGSTPSGANSLTREQLTKALTSTQGGAGFEPELLGRFSWIVAFDVISRDTYGKVLAAAFGRLREDIERTNPYLATSLPDELTDDQIAEFIDSSYVPAQGARPAETTIRHWIEELLDPSS